MNQLTESYAPFYNVNWLDYDDKCVIISWVLYESIRLAIGRLWCIWNTCLCITLSAAGAIQLLYTKQHLPDRMFYVVCMQICEHITGMKEEKGNDIGQCSPSNIYCIWTDKNASHLLVQLHHNEYRCCFSFTSDHFTTTSSSRCIEWILS